MKLSGTKHQSSMALDGQALDSKFVSDHTQRVTTSVATKRKKTDQLRAGVLSPPTDPVQRHFSTSMENQKKIMESTFNRNSFQKKSCDPLTKTTSFL